MAWKRTGFKGINAEELVSTVKSGEGLVVEDTAIELTESNKLTYPGAISFDNMTGVSFNSTFSSTAIHFGTTIISRWFRDAGNTTT